MGRGEQAAGSPWLRTIAHLAIVVVFVLSALGYAPLGEHAVEPAKAMDKADRKLAAAQRTCKPGAVGDSVVPEQGRPRPASLRTCDQPNAHRSSNTDRTPDALPAH